jgi:predicted ATPase with chaperone activity
MVQRVSTVAFEGIEARAVDVRMQVVPGLPNFLMIGSPGSGQSMLAARLPSILPPLSPAELLEVSMIASVAGEILGGAPTARPIIPPAWRRSPAAACGQTRRNLAGTSRRAVSR